LGNHYTIRVEMLCRELKALKLRIVALEKKMKPQPQTINKNGLLDLPDHLRDTYLAVLQSGKATATQVSQITRKARAVESNYANQLTLAGWLYKTKEGHKTFFVTINREAFPVEVTT